MKNLVYRFLSFLEHESICVLQNLTTCHYNMTAYVVKCSVLCYIPFNSISIRFISLSIPLVFHLICVDCFKLKLILTIVFVCTKICLLLATAPQVALRLKISEENNVIIA